MGFKNKSGKKKSEYLPLIGISCHLNNEEDFYAVKRDYISAIERAGGMPLIIPVIGKGKLRNHLVKSFDGLVLTGGFGRTDITKKSFIPLKEQNPPRYKFDEYLIKYALKNNLPLLGICRGHQMLNEISGGAINLKLPTEKIQHYQAVPKHLPSHNISLVKNTKLHQFLNTKIIKVNSLHTQGIKKIAPDFIASATADDGVIEAIESEKHAFIIGLQFHPEKMVNSLPKFRKIFTCFIDECKKKKKEN